MESPGKTAGTAGMPHTALKGEVVYIRAFDLAYDMRRQRILHILGQPVQEYTVGPSKPAPEAGLLLSAADGDAAIENVRDLRAGRWRFH